MPIYDFICHDCARIQPVFRKIHERNRAEPCGICLTEMQRMIAAPRVQADYPGYSCPITGKWVEGRKAHAENLKRHGCRVYEPGETEAAKRASAAADAAFDATIENTVEEFVETLPTAKREKLIAEVENGLDVAVVRQ
jgi:putative FmdB family regulatory protein